MQGHMSQKRMLRTNQSFLAYTEDLYNQQNRKENIIIKRYQRGDRLLSQHEAAAKVMLIKEGITKCFFSEENDKEYILEFLGKGEIIGDIEVIRNRPCLCNVEALTDLSVYAFSIPYFRTLLQRDIILNDLLLNVFADRIINTSSRASFQQLYTVEHSLAKLMEMSYKQDIAISKEDMAAYLGISVRSLNRTIKSLKNKDQH